MQHAKKASATPSGGARGARPKREAYHHGDLHAALVRAALQVVVRHGPDRVSLRALARQVGVSPRAPYRHFPTKEALLAAVATEAFQRYEERLDAAVALAGPDPLERFNARGRAYVAFAVEHPALFRAMNPPHGTVDEHAPELIAARTRLHEAMLHDIVEAQRARTVRPGEPMCIALTAWALVHGLALLLVEGQLARYPGRIEPEDLVRAVAQTLHDGLAPPRRHSRARTDQRA